MLIECQNKKTYIEKSSIIKYEIIKYDYNKNVFLLIAYLNHGYIPDNNNSPLNIDDKCQIIGTFETRVKAKEYLFNIVYFQGIFFEWGGETKTED